MRYTNIFRMVGQTPHLKVSHPEAENVNVYIKLEGTNPTGSLKDRACVHMLREAIEKGGLRRGMTVLDASSGNFACAVAYYGKLLGYKTAVVANSKLTASKRDFILYYGAALEKVGDFTIQGNRHCREMAEAEPNRYYFLDQLHNWDNPRAHYETTGPEILADFPRLSMLVGSLGSGGTLYGAAQFLKERVEGLRVAAVQSAPGTKLPGTGSFDDGDYMTPFIRKGFDDQLFDCAVRITERDAVKRTLELREQGIFCGLQTGGVLHAALTAVRKYGVEGDVLVISGDMGWKNMDKLLSI